MSSTPTYDVIVVGGGAAGVGVAVALKDAGVKNFIVLERLIVGASFSMWPRETRFITPSFPTNSIGMLDLNSIALGTSPAVMLKVEHPTGQDYAVYLNVIAEYFELPVQTHTAVLRVTRVGEDFRVDTEEETLRAKYVIWAAGEFQFPQRRGFEGSELCRHTATITRYGDLDGDDFIIIGGYESGVDAAYHLAQEGKHARLFDAGCPWRSRDPDPSVSLSTYSLERMRDERFVEQVELFPDTTIASVARIDEGYEVTTTTGRRARSPTSPLLASGFRGGHERLGRLFESRPDGLPMLTDEDESTVTPGLFLCGPSVRHDGHIFCFIYKYRQRFAVVARAIAGSLGLPDDWLEGYRRWGMYLDDLSCCGEGCVC